MPLMAVMTGTSMSLMKFSTKFIVSGTLQLYCRVVSPESSTSSNDEGSLRCVIQ